MTDSPDSWLDDHATARWVRLFFAEQGWALDEEGPPDDIAARRADSENDLTRIELTSTLTPDDRRAFAGRKNTLAKDITAATDIADFDAIDMRIATLTNDIDAKEKVAAARILAAKAVSEMEARRAGLAPDLDRGTLLYVNEKAGKIHVDHRQAHSKDDYTRIKAACVKFMTTADQAEVYGTYVKNWAATSAQLIVSAVPAPQKNAVATARKTAADAAATDSRNGDFAGAKSKLQAFNAAGHAGPGFDFDAAVAFVAEVERLESEYGAKLAEIAASGLQGVGAMKNEISNIRTQGVTNAQIPQAQARIAPLKIWVDGNLPIARLTKRMDKSANKLEPYRNAITAMENDRSNARWADALSKLTAALDERTPLGQQVASIVTDRRLAATYQALLARTAGAVKTGLQKRWNAHHAVATANPIDPAAAKAKLEDLREWLKIGEFYEARDKIKALAQNHPAAKTYEYGATATELFNKRNFDGAIAALGPLFEKTPKLCAYLDAKDAANLLHKSLPVAPPDLRNTVSDAINDAEEKAKDKDPQGALDHLDHVLSGTELQAFALAVTDYQQIAATVEAEHNYVLTFVDDSAMPTIAKALQDGFDDAAKLAFPGYKFNDAIDAMQAHLAMLGAVRGCMTVRVTTQSTIQALDRATKQDATWAAQMFTGGTSLAALKTAFTAADTRAKSSKFHDAKKAYETITTGCTHAMNVAVINYETADSVGSDAGHSRESHGKQVTEAQHVTRLTTGVAPGNRASPTNISSSFASDTDWLAGRELGAELAFTKNGVDVTATSMFWPGSEPDNQAFIIDHGRPIGIAYRGVRKAKEYDEDTNTFKDSKTYETYEKLTGLTRAQVLFVWEVDGTCNTLAEYAALHPATTGTPPRVTVPGRWVMMQQFPVGEGWIQAEQRYDKPLSNLP